MTFSGRPLISSCRTVFVRNVGGAEGMMMALPPEGRVLIGAGGAGASAAGCGCGFVVVLQQAPRRIAAAIIEVFIVTLRCDFCVRSLPIFHGTRRVMSKPFLV